MKIRDILTLQKNTECVPMPNILTAFLKFIFLSFCLLQGVRRKAQQKIRAHRLVGSDFFRIFAG